MAHKQNYQAWLKTEFTALIDSLALDDLIKHALRSRWLDQTLWMEVQAQRNRRGYHILRLTAIIGGVTIPALISLNVSGDAVVWTQMAILTRWIVFIISLLVAISVAVEEFFHYGERWRHYRRMAETLKTEGWSFFQLTGTYRHCKSHTEAYPRFASRIEEISQEDVQTYTAQMMLETKDAEQKLAGKSPDKTNVP